MFRNIDVQNICKFKYFHVDFCFYYLKAEKMGTRTKPMVFNVNSWSIS